MYSPIVTNDPGAVGLEAKSAFLAMFPNSDPTPISHAFEWATEAFVGNYKDYQAIDAKYHDFEHTMQGTLCMVRLLRGRYSAGAHPVTTERLFVLGMLAILVHDTGYLKKRGDTEGTGAKYTATHVDRSVEFAAQLLSEKGFSRVDIQAVQNMIRCTGVDATLSEIPFRDEAEKLTGHALGTADLLGQMAADDYVGKLPVLYAEFAEALRHDHEKMQFIGLFSSAEDLMRKTPAFWQNYVRPKLDRDFSGLYRFLNDPFPDGPNPYFERIEANIGRLKQKVVTTG